MRKKIQKNTIRIPAKFASITFSLVACFTLLLLMSSCTKHTDNFAGNAIDPSTFDIHQFDPFEITTQQSFQGVNDGDYGLVQTNYLVTRGDSFVIASRHLDNRGDYASGRRLGMFNRGDSRLEQELRNSQFNFPEIIHIEGGRITDVSGGSPRCVDTSAAGGGGRMRIRFDENTCAGNSHGPAHFENGGVDTYIQLIGGLRLIILQRAPHVAIRLEYLPITNQNIAPPTRHAPRISPVPPGTRHPQPNHHREPDPDDQGEDGL